MPTLNPLSVVFLALQSIIVAASVELEASTTGSEFSLTVSKAHENQECGYLNAWAAAHRKWGSGKPVEAAEALILADGEGQVSAVPIKNDQIYVAQVEIGNPPQKIKLAMNTGSSDVWVQSTDTAYRINHAGPWPERYSPNASRTAHRVEKAVWEISYADLSNALGIVYCDTLRMGGVEVNDVFIESAARISPSFEHQTDFGGPHGACKRVANTIEPIQPTFLSLLKRQLKQSAFTVDLRANGTSRFDFGHIDESLALNKITWLDRKPGNPHWSIDLYLVAIPGRNHSAWLHHKFEAIVEADRLPDILIKLPGTEHVVRIPGRYLNYGPLEQDSVPFLGWHAECGPI